MVRLGQFEAMAHYVPVCLQEMGQAAASQQPDFSDPPALSQIAAPILLLHGAKTGAWATDSVRHLTDHLPHVEVREIPDATHFGPLLAPEAVANEIIRFFDEAA